MKKQISAAEYEKLLLERLNVQIKEAKKLAKYDCTGYNSGYLKALMNLRTGILWNSPLRG